MDLQKAVKQCRSLRIHCGNVFWRVQDPFTQESLCTLHLQQASMERSSIAVLKQILPHVGQYLSTLTSNCENASEAVSYQAFARILLWSLNKEFCEFSEKIRQSDGCHILSSTYFVYQKILLQKRNRGSHFHTFSTGIVQQILS